MPENITMVLVIGAFELIGLAVLLGLISRKFEGTRKEKRRFQLITALIIIGSYALYVYVALTDTIIY